MTDFCSDYQVEPLPGTAKKESVFVLFEWPGGWSRDVLDGDTFGPELTAQLKEKLNGQAGLQLIRRPGRDGRQIGTMHRCYLVWAEQGVMELILLTGPEKILDLDLTAPGRNGGGTLDTPLVLVCTHAKRDKCCAVKGRPLAAELVEDYPDMVWETSHTTTRCASSWPHTIHSPRSTATPSLPSWTDNSSHEQKTNGPDIPHLDAKQAPYQFVMSIRSGDCLLHRPVPDAVILRPHWFTEKN